MLENENRKKVAEQILKYGWVEATPENIKAYMDGFEMARRRSFEENNISAQEYIERLNNHGKHPIHIVDARQIAQAAIDRKITRDSTKEAGELIQGLDLEIEKEEISH